MSNVKTIVFVHRYLDGTGATAGNEQVTGLLVDPALVMVPSPPSWLSGGARLVAAISATGAGDGAEAGQGLPPPEVIAGRQLYLLGLGKEPAVGYLRLARPASHAPIEAGPDTTARLDEAFGPAEGDYWEAMRLAGLVSGGERELAAGELAPHGLAGLLSAAGDVEPVRATETIVDSLADLLTRDCCKPVFPRTCCENCFAGW
ncbi:hypothetical protein [Longispora albida]|uniref:hypothetical protein n=1 Tax=Longispora albida TaxID=203523 RepID=UPI00036099B7|nr:hypothetical protein [Longispora albida]